MSNSANLIFDLGSHTIRCGLASMNEPDIVIPSAFPASDHAHPISDPIPADSEVDFAIVDGGVDKGNPNSIERMNFLFASFYDHYFPEDAPQPDSLQVSFNDIPLSDKYHAEYCAEMCFELLGATEITIKPPATYALTTMSLPTCICVDIGYDITHTVPVAHHLVIPQACNRSFLAGSALDLFTARYRLQYNEVNKWSQFQAIEELKRSQLRVALNLEDELDDSDCYGVTCGELLFTPSLFEAALIDGQKDERISSLMEEPSIAQLITTSITDCDLAVRGDLWSNIIVTGGTCLTAGFRERLQVELDHLSPERCKPVLRFVEDPLVAPWQGAKCSGAFQESWFTADEYEEDKFKIHEKFRVFFPYKDPAEALAK